MKVLFDHQSPFSFAHGGIQTQIEKTRSALLETGVEVEFLRWWDDTQTGDLVHYFGTPPVPYLELARRQKLPVLVTNTFSETCNRSDAHLRAQGLVIQSLLRLPGWEWIKRQLAWSAYGRADCNIVGLEAERNVLRVVYGVPDNRIRVVPLALADPFLNVQPGSAKQDYLITTGSINSVKRSLELAKMAQAAQVPILFVGKPYNPADPYWKEFMTLIDDRFVRHQDHVSDPNVMIDLLKKARGFVIYSRYENWCLSAHEAAACGLPLLLPRKRWSVERFDSQATFFPDGTFDESVAALKDFYSRTSQLAAPQIPRRSWKDVAGDLTKIYREFAGG